MKLQLKMIAQLSAILLIALAVKSFFSTASVNDLRWILAPTTFFVELVTGKQFIFESQAGYMSTDHTFLIAASCSGVNFLIISFVVLALGKLWREWPRNIAWWSLAFAPFVAYLTTIVANTTRIVIALYSQNIQTSWLDHDELHRVQGVVIYFGFLLLLVVVIEKIAARGADFSTLVEAIAVRSKYILVVYYTVTLGVPLVRAGYRDTGFWQHSAVVIVIPLALLFPCVVLSWIKKNRLKQSSTTGVPSPARPSAKTNSHHREILSNSLFR